MNVFSIIQNTFRKNPYSVLIYPQSPNRPVNNDDRWAISKIIAKNHLPGLSTSAPTYAKSSSKREAKQLRSMVPYCVIPLPASIKCLALQIISSRKAEERRFHIRERLSICQRWSPDGFPGVKVTWAMSARMPFSLFLNVGGNNDNIAKLMISPAAEFPFTVIANMLFVDPGAMFVFRETLTCFQVVWEPVMETFWEFKIVPALSCRLMTKLPRNLEAVWNR